MQLGSLLLAVLLTLASGWLMFSLIGKDPAGALHGLLVEPLLSINGWSELLLKAVPISLIALGLVVCFRANVWNIGAEGQMLVGGICASGVALFLPFSGPWCLASMLGASCLGGMAWAAIPAFLKTSFHTSEILVSLMLTYIAEKLLLYLVSGPWRDPQGMNFPLTKMFSDVALLPLFHADWHWAFSKGTQLNGGLFLPVLVAPLIWLFFQRSYVGYQLVVIGLAPRAASYAGFHVGDAVWKALLTSGGLAGIAGMTEVAGPLGQLQSTWSPGYGYTAIIAAFVGRLHPFGTVCASLLMALFYLGGETVQMSMQMPKAICAVFQGLFLFFLLGCDLFTHQRLRQAPALPRSTTASAA